MVSILRKSHHSLENNRLENKVTLGSKKKRFAHAKQSPIEESVQICSNPPLLFVLHMLSVQVVFSSNEKTVMLIGFVVTERQKRRPIIYNEGNLFQ